MRAFGNSPFLLDSPFSVEPYAGLAWANLRSRALQECDGSAALSGASQSDQSTTTTLGVRGRQALTPDKFEGALTAGADWRHAFGDLNPATKMAFDAGDAFTVAGVPRNAALLEAGLESFRRVPAARRLPYGLLPRCRIAHRSPRLP